MRWLSQYLTNSKYQQLILKCINYFSIYSAIPTLNTIDGKIVRKDKVITNFSLNCVICWSSDILVMSIKGWIGTRKRTIHMENREAFRAWTHSKGKEFSMTSWIPYKMFLFRMEKWFSCQAVIGLPAWISLPVLKERQDSEIKTKGQFYWKLYNFGAQHVSFWHASNKF